MRIAYDLHLHSCLSPCGDRDMTPSNLVNMARLAGLDCIALTDHNSCLNVPAARKAAEGTGLTVVPGMELCTAEEAHVVCLLPTEAAALEFSAAVRRTLPDVENRPEIFGEQLILDEEEGLLGQEELLLATTPERAVLSVGYNTYGHPADETLERLAAAGCEIYRTDWMGSVRVTAKG